MYCEKCGNGTDDDATYCPSCGVLMNDQVIAQDTKNESTYKLKMAGFLIILVGIIGVVDTVSFRLIWNQEWNQLIFGSWYQFIYIFLYVLGIVYGIRLVKKKDWVINFVIILIYIIHSVGMFIEKNIKSPVIMLYAIIILSIIVLILLMMTKGEFDISQHK